MCAGNGCPWLGLLELRVEFWRKSMSAERRRGKRRRGREERESILAFTKRKNRNFSCNNSLSVRFLPVTF
jgi:hypothetical protein